MLKLRQVMNSNYVKQYRGIALFVVGIVLLLLSNIAFIIYIALVVTLGVAYLVYDERQDEKEREENREGLRLEREREVEMRKMIHLAFSLARNKPVDITLRYDAPKVNRAGYPHDWSERRERVLIRDNHRCILCGEDLHIARGHVHHIIPKSVYPNHEYNNLVSLCRQCHAIMGDKHELMSRPYYSINDETKCFHTTKCKHASSANRRSPILPDGYHACQDCDPFNSVRLIGLGARAKQQRARYRIIEEYLTANIDFSSQELSKIPEEPIHTSPVTVFDEAFDALIQLNFTKEESRRVLEAFPVKYCPEPTIEELLQYALKNIYS